MGCKPFACYQRVVAIKKNSFVQITWIYAFICSYWFQGKAKKPRNKNFTGAEIQALAAFVKENTHTLYGKAGHCSRRVSVDSNKCTFMWKSEYQNMRKAQSIILFEWIRPLTLWLDSG